MWAWKWHRLKMRWHAFKVGCPQPHWHPAHCPCWPGKGKWKK